MKMIYRILAIAITMSYGFGCYGEVKKVQVESEQLKREKYFKKLWLELKKNNVQLTDWRPNWTSEELTSRFKQMQRDRWNVYFSNPKDFGKNDTLGKWKDIFTMPKNYKTWGARYSYPIAFQYALANPNYNASVVTIKGINFLALEAPTNKNIDIFFQILQDYKITDLVRLTPQVYQGREGSVPYWDGHLDIHEVDGRTALTIKNIQINYFATDLWEDHQGIEPKKLIALVKAVQKSSVIDTKYIAVHCRAGVGRTGVFIVAYALIDSIDKQLANGIDVDHVKVNIDQTIWELSLQRPFAVTHFPQYLTLYQMVDYYLKNISSLGYSK